MKKNNLILLALAMLMSTVAMAQLELKVNPIGVLFSSPDVSAEYIITDDIGVQLTLGLEYGKVAAGLGGIDLKKSGYKLRAVGKYYFKPQEGGDRFYAGLYLGPRSRTTTDDNDDGFDFGYKISAFTAGLTAGFKWVGQKGILFEIGAGLGRAFGDTIEYNDANNMETIDGFGLDGFGMLAIGYRFGG